MKAGLVGHGIGPSLTPGMHEAEGRALRLDYSYTRLDTTEAPWNTLSLAEILDFAEVEGFAGLNITHPHKAEVTAHIDALQGAASALGTVNTLVFSGGQRIGHNTDFTGFQTALRSSGLPVRGKEILQYGAGGAGAATALALIDEGARLRLTDISLDRAERTAEALMCARPAADISVLPLSRVPIVRAAGAVNATPLGMAAHPGIAFDPVALPQHAWVADIVYFPLETALIAKARGLGLAVLDGGGMALHQAIGAFELITGQRPDTGRMGRIFQKLLSEREVTSKPGAA